MFLLLFFTLLLSWQFLEWLKLRKVIQVSKQIKCSLTAYPLVGHGYMFFGNGIRRMEMLKLFGREVIKEGKTNLWLGRNYFMVSADPVDIELISSACLEKDDIMRFARNVIGNGTIFAPVKIWRPRRKNLAKTFRPNTLRDFVKIFANKSSLMVKQLKKEAGQGSFPIWNYLTSYTMDSVCGTALDVDSNALEHGGSPLLSSFSIICKLVAVRSFSPWLHLDCLYKLLPQYDSFCRNKKTLCDFVDEIIKAKSACFRSDHKTLDKEEGNTTKTFLELLIKASGSEKGFSDKELQEEILVILLAGTDTSAVGASFTAVMLSRHQDVQEKVYKELQEVFKGSDRPIEAEDLSKLQYLEVVLKETLRLYPPVPIIVRKVESNVTLPSGVTLVPGCGVMFHIWALQRNPKYWGPDAENFRPQRFFDTNPTHPKAYMAFSSGPRNCLGYQYAMMSMKTALASLLRQYRILPDKAARADDSDLRLVYDLMMKDADSFVIELENRA